MFFKKLIKKEEKKGIDGFKVGGQVRNRKSGEIDIVVFLPGMPEYDRCSFIQANEGMTLVRNGWEFRKSWEPVETSYDYVAHTKIDALAKALGFEWVEEKTTTEPAKFVKTEDKYKSFEALNLSGKELSFEDISNRTFITPTPKKRKYTKHAKKAKSKSSKK